MPPLRMEDQWIAIQHKTFLNWANEQLIQSNRSVENLATDLCDGVKLVALVEALQFKKIGKVYSKPASRIQMLHNVSLALQAVADDHIKLVNIGTDDIVGGNLKLILGLLWHLIIRYQISSSKAKAPPKKLMLSWFQNALPSLNITNFTSHWRDGIALHALLEYCKPGLSPNWKKLSPNNSLQNCKQAMQLAFEHLRVPRVISAEDFTSSDLDELSAMTYLSYFIRKNSPGYYSTLNWVCRQLKTTNISNLTTDWNDGYFLCALVRSFGGEVKGWPNIDRKDHVATCQLGIDSALTLGVEPVLTAVELSDPKVDHLSVMAYISKFQHIKPQKAKAERLVVNCYLLGIKAGSTVITLECFSGAAGDKVCTDNHAKFVTRLREQLYGFLVNPITADGKFTSAETSFKIVPSDSNTERDKVKAWVSGPTRQPTCQIKWVDKAAECSFQTHESGSHQLHVQYDGVEIAGCPISFTVQQDISKVKVYGDQPLCRVGQNYSVQIFSPPDVADSIEVRVISPTGDLQLLETEPNTAGLTASFRPSCIGMWKYQTNAGSQEVDSSQVMVYDPHKARLTGPESGIVGEELMFKVNMTDCGCDELVAEVKDSNNKKLDNVEVKVMGTVRHITFTPYSAGAHRVKALMRGEQVKDSPRKVAVVDLGKIHAAGEGLSRGTKGVASYFLVDKSGMSGEVTAVVEVSGEQIRVVKDERGKDEYEFHYVPTKVGTYTINIYWSGKAVAGSPFSASVTDKSNVILKDDLSEMKDENDHLALIYGEPTKLNFDISQAGPGTFKAEVLSPDGKLPVNVDQTSHKAVVSFTALSEGDHYIHLYWSDAPIEYSPLLAYCPGPPLPVDATKVAILGSGAQSARATVPAEFVIDGRQAGPGVPKVRLQGVQSDLPVEMKPLKYNRYRCKYTSNFPGGYLLFVYWSDCLLPGCPLKVNVTAKGNVRKVKVTGEGMNGGIAGEELKLFVDTREAGQGEVTAECHSNRHTASCDVKDNGDGQYTLRILPTEPEKHVLSIMYDGQHVTGSPFILRVSEPPDPTKVRVFGPGIEDGLVDTFESRFLVDTAGAGAGQLAVKIRGPRGGFKVEMQRETKADRTIVCRYDPSEPGEYIIQVRWSGVHVPGSPFAVHVVDTMDELNRLIVERGYVPRDRQMDWRVEI